MVYLASLAVIHRATPALEEIPIGWEFSDVFPDELPGMPLDWEIKFFIDLVPSTTPILKAMYRMAFAEPKELKVQLEDLMNKRFNRPGVIL